MWGRPASPRPAGLGMPPRVHRLLDSGSDYLLESVGSWLRLAVACAGPSRPLGLPRLCSALLCSALVPSPGKWVAEIYLILGCLVDLWMDVEAFRCIQLNQGLTLDLEPLDCFILSLVRSRGLACGGAKPAGLGETGRPGILPNSAQFWYTCP